MKENLGQSAEVIAQKTPAHPGIMLLEAIDDSHIRREVKTHEDHVLKVGVEIELARNGVGDGTINGYTLEHQINLSRMLGKDAWRS